MNVCIAAGSAAKEQSLPGGDAPLAFVGEASAAVARPLESGMFVMWRWAVGLLLSGLLVGGLTFWLSGLLSWVG